MVQENAANAEEAAATSTQLKEQAEHMRDFVNRLMVLVEGGQGDAETGGGAEVNLLQNPAVKHPQARPGARVHKQGTAKMTSSRTFTGTPGGSKTAEKHVSTGNGKVDF